MAVLQSLVRLWAKNPRTSSFKGRHSPLFEIALVLVRFDHVASLIVNPDHGVL